MTTIIIIIKKEFEKSEQVEREYNAAQITLQLQCVTVKNDP